jgi:hypothetical protein
VDLAPSLSHLVGQGQGNPPEVDDPRGRAPQAPNPDDVRLDLADPFGADDLETLDPVCLGACAERLEPG